MTKISIMVDYGGGEPYLLEGKSEIPISNFGLESKVRWENEKGFNGLMMPLKNVRSNNIRSALTSILNYFENRKFISDKKGYEISIKVNPDCLLSEQKR